MRQPADYVGKPVTSLQTMLRGIAAADPAVPAPIPDGIYGTQTMRAVTAFQRCAGLPPTGVTDFATWQAIVAAFEKAAPTLAPAAPLQLELPADQSLCEGSENLHVPLIQAMLHTLAQLYDNLPDCTVCGRYDQETAAAVRALQDVCGMEPTGVLDKACWQRLSALYTQATGNGAAPPRAAAAAPLPLAELPPITVQVHGDPALQALF